MEAAASGSPGLLIRGVEMVFCTSPTRLLRQGRTVAPGLARGSGDQQSVDLRAGAPSPLPPLDKNSHQRPQCLGQCCPCRPGVRTASSLSAFSPVTHPLCTNPAPGNLRPPPPPTAYCAVSCGSLAVVQEFQPVCLCLWGLWPLLRAQLRSLRGAAVCF